MVRFGTGDLSVRTEAPCPCGRTSARMLGWRGRADEVTKVRGMFVHPRQADEVAARVSGVQRYQVVVGREGHQDTLTLRVELAPDTPADSIRAAGEAAIRAVMKLRGSVDIEVVNVPSDRTTVFTLEASPGGRRLMVLSRAVDLEEGHLPGDWRGVPLAMLCPVINEVDPALAGSFAEASLGVASQGWMRRRGAGGAITPEPWEDADIVLPHAQLLVVSSEDIEDSQKTALEWFQHVPLGAVTRGPEGAILFVN